MGKHRCVFRSRVRILSRLSERERRQNMSPLPSFVLCIPLRLRAAGCLLRSIYAAKEETAATLFLLFARIPIAGRPLPVTPLSAVHPAGSVLSPKSRGTRRPARSGGGCRSHTILPPYGANRMLRLPAAAFLRFSARPFFKKGRRLAPQHPSLPATAPPGRRVPGVATFFKVFRRAFLQKDRRLAPQHPCPAAAAPLFSRSPRPRRLAHCRHV